MANYSLLCVTKDWGNWHITEMGEDPPTYEEIHKVCGEWARKDDWGVDGAVAVVMWTLVCDGDDVDKGKIDVEIEPDHDALIREAGGDPDCDHDWTSEGEGGLEENPGVWSVGGTALVFHYHCRKCGLHQCHHFLGSQRNPGEHDTYEYTQPERWCAKCQHEECQCDQE